MKKPYAITVLSYNHPELTAKCINSVLNHAEPNNVFLAHNGSQEKNIAYLKDIFPKIQHIVIRENKGYTAGANQALRETFSHAESVLFLTNDTELLHLPDTPPAHFSSIKLLRRNSQEIDSVMGSLNPKNGRLKHLKCLTDQRSDELTYIPGTAFWINKSVFNQLNGFDERFHTYWEDVDFSLRAHKNNIPVQYDENTVCRHKIGKTCHKDRFYTYELFQRNRGRCLSKHKLTSIRFYLSYIKDILKYSRSDYRRAYSIFTNHRLKDHL